MQIVIASGKGGVGKSTVSSSLIYLLKDEHEIIAVDADADAPNLDLLFGVETWEEEKELSGAKVAKINHDSCIKCGVCAERCPYDCIKLTNGNYVVSDITCEGCGVCALICPVKGTIALKEVRSGVIRKTTTRYGFPLISAQLDVGRPNSGKLVTEEKNWAKKIMEKQEIEHMVVDSAAGIGCQVIASLGGADAAILVAEPTPASLSDLKRIYKVVQHFREPAYIVINKSDLNPGFEGIHEFAEQEGIPILGGIPYDRAVPESMVKMRPVVEVFPGSKASKALKEIARAVEEEVLK